MLASRTTIGSGTVGILVHMESMLARCEARQVRDHAHPAIFLNEANRSSHLIALRRTNCCDGNLGTGGRGRFGNVRLRLAIRGRGITATSAEDAERGSCQESIRGS